MNTLMKRNNGNGNVPSTSFSGLVDNIFQNNLARLFDDDFWGFRGQEQNMHVPVNIRQTEKSYELELMAPGLKKEDFKININNDLLTISLENQETNNQQQEEGWLRKEYKLRSFSRNFSLADNIDASKITAEYTNGILHVSLPIKEGSQPILRAIQVK